MIYLDYAANSPVDKEVLEAYNEATLKYYANPNSSHKLGIEAKGIIDMSSLNIAKNLGIDKDEIIYTSGATEANNLVVKGICGRYKNKGKHIILSSLEHNSLIAPATVMQEEGYEIDLLPITKDGFVDINELKNIIRDDTILVSVVSVDSEIGIRQPIEEIAKILKKYPNCYFHTDASQAIGKVSIDFSGVDLITIAPHKFYGLNGFGMLVKRSNVSLSPIIHGGRSTTVYRSGTPVLNQVVALDKALDLALKNQKKYFKYVEKLNKILKDGLSKYDNVHINSTDSSIPYIVNISLKKVKSTKLSEKLEENDVYISTKTSCCPVGTPSKLVYALTHDKGLASSSIRISLSYLTTEEEVNKFLKIFDKCYKELI